ncbi:hypothetical protein CTA1_7794 [Colletotrichum tanaceti]|uniref:Uncharacterized protein n=1 Tax=Colletotrichum tanaceti TaxID=1306861 RepID=A0A4U6XNN7_9PEZI|nr:hypothetical protein CTA1_7794 [Colletotrichum tanaceti]
MNCQVNARRQLRTMLRCICGTQKEKYTMATLLTKTLRTRGYQDVEAIETRRISETIMAKRNMTAWNVTSGPIRWPPPVPVPAVGTAAAPLAASAISASMSWSKGTMIGGDGALLRGPAVTGCGRESASAVAAGVAGVRGVSLLAFCSLSARRLFSGSCTLWISARKNPPSDMDRNAAKRSDSDSRYVMLASSAHMDAAAKIPPSTMTIMLIVE